MKTARTSPVIVPLQGKDIQKEYGLTSPEAKKAVEKMSGHYAKRKKAGKVTRVKGRFDEKFFA